MYGALIGTARPSTVTVWVVTRSIACHRGHPPVWRYERATSAHDHDFPPDFASSHQPLVGWRRDLSDLWDQQQMVGSSTLIPDRSSMRIAAAAQRVFAMGRGTVLASSWYRAALPRYSTSSQLLSGRGTLIRGGRWCPPGFMLTLHLADTPENSVAEYLANHRRHGIPIPADLHLVIRAVQIEIACALDLRDGVVRQALGVSRQRMLETRWEQENAAGHESISQAVGRAVAAAGFTAMVVPSAAVARAANLVVFPELLRGQDRVEVCDAE